MTERAASPRDAVRPLLRARQVREFTDEPLDPGQLDAVVDAGRWSGSSRNTQPWRFIVIRDPGTLRQLHQAGLPQTRSLATAGAAIAVVLPDDPAMEVSHAYDEGRAAERMLVAASMLGLAAGIGWIRPDVRAAVSQILGLPENRLVRTILALGHPSEAARRPKTPKGEARLPREEVVFAERWPAR